MRLKLSFRFVARAAFAALASLGISAKSQAQTQIEPPPAAADTQPVQPLPGADAIERLTSRMNPCPCPSEVPPAPFPFGGPLHERPKLTGDWLGYRSRLRDCGVTVDVSTTQYYQGVTTGGLERSFASGGRNDYFLTLDGEKLGLWKGLFFKFHGETRYSESANFNTGALSPVNEYLLVPGTTGTAGGLTGAKVGQYLTENTLLFAGKINLLDEIHQPLTGVVSQFDSRRPCFQAVACQTETLPRSAVLTNLSGSASPTAVGSRRAVATSPRVRSRDGPRVSARSSWNTNVFCDSTSWSPSRASPSGRRGPECRPRDGERARPADTIEPPGDRAGPEQDEQSRLPSDHFLGGLPSTNTPGTFFLPNSSLNFGRSSDSTRCSLASSSSVC
jgi:hypothetical protein